VRVCACVCLGRDVDVGLFVPLVTGYICTAGRRRGGARVLVCHARVCVCVQE
jgi:hypothetical protein